MALCSVIGWQLPREAWSWLHITAAWPWAVTRLEREVVRLSRRARKALRDLALSSPLRLSLLGVYPSVYSGPGLLFSPTHRRCDLALGPSTAISSA